MIGTKLSRILFCSTLLLFNALSQAAGGNGAPPPPVVDVVVLQAQPVVIRERFSGRVVAAESAEVRPQLSGLILSRQFVEGSVVQAGDQLYQIDPALYQAELASAEAQLAIAEVNANNAQRLADRFAELSKKSAVSKQQYEDALASRDQARAQILLAKAAIERAQINLQHTRIAAPISGVIGRSTVNNGALVSAQQAQPLAEIQGLEQVYVDVPLPVRALLQMRQQADALTLPVRLELEDGSVYPVDGEIRFIESAVDSGTGTVNLRALFANPQQQLLPGMFVRVDLAVASRQEAILAPQTGIGRTPQGSGTALVVNDQNQVEQRRVTTGATVGDQWLIESGLNAGDRLIVSGVQKVRPGATVSVQIRSEQ